MARAAKGRGPVKLKRSHVTSAGSGPSNHLLLLPETSLGNKVLSILAFDFLPSVNHCDLLPFTVYFRLLALPKEELIQLILLKMTP